MDRLIEYQTGTLNVSYFHANRKLIVEACRPMEIQPHTCYHKLDAKPFTDSVLFKAQMS